jgi:ankyrin repeat protein
MCNAPFLVLGLALVWGAPAIGVAAPNGGPVAETWVGGKPQPVKPVRRHVPMPSGDAVQAVFRLERSGCYGPCPDYAVEVHGDGEIVYEGRCNVVVDGRHLWRAAPADVAALLGQVRAADFWSLKARYAASITDNATYRLSVTIGGRTKTLEDYVGLAVGMPKSVRALEDAVDHITGADRWLVGDTSTIPALEAEGWDFHGPAAAQVLARAAAEAPEEVALELLARGAPASSNAPDSGCYREDSSSAVENAAEHRRLTLLRALISAGAFTSSGSKEAALFGAVVSGQPAIVSEVLQYHPDVNARRQEENDTPLLWIIEGPHPFVEENPPQSDFPQIIRLLVSAGANPNLADDFGNTPLHEVRDADAAKALIAGGAALEARNRQGQTPLLATFDENVALALIDAGADTAARTPQGAGLRDLASAHSWRRVLARLATAK